MPTPCGDDLYILYTGGTTGMPKGVLWRQHDIFMSAMGGRPFTGGPELTSYEDLTQQALAAPGMRSFLVLPPLMHGAAQWGACPPGNSGSSGPARCVSSAYDAAGRFLALQFDAPVTLEHGLGLAWPAQDGPAAAEADPMLPARHGRRWRRQEARMLRRIQGKPLIIPCIRCR
jgi:hypothetical protein